MDEQKNKNSPAPKGEGSRPLGAGHQGVFDRKGIGSVDTEHHSPAPSPLQATGYSRTISNNSEEIPASTPTPKPEDALQTIRTYRGDVMDAVRHGETISSIAMAEQKRRLFGRQNADISEADTQKSNWNYIIIGVSILLVSIGIVALGTLLLRPEETPAVPPPLVLPQEAIFSDREKELPLSRFTRQEILGLVSFETREANIPTNQIPTFIFSKEVESTTPEGVRVPQKIRIGIREIFNATQGSVPQTLLRSIDDMFIFGAYSFRGNNPFLIFNTNTYESAFSGMLQWEQTIAQDIIPLFGSHESGNATFKDVVIRNRDARVLENDAGDLVLLYSFLDKKTLVITTNEATFGELLRRFLTPREVLR